MKTAINLYSVRDLEEPMEALLERVADAGYDGVEFAGGFRDATPTAVAETLDRLNLEVAGVHVGIEDLESDFGAAYETYAETLGAPSAVVPWLPPEAFSDTESVASTVDRLASLTVTADAYDWPLHYHNHDHEFRAVDGTRPIDRLLESVPGLGFEIDVGWVATAGADPVEYIDRYADRIELVHMKDMATESGAFREIGQGDVDMAACAEAAESAGAEWLIYEHDEPEDPAASIETGSGFLETL
ncbi:sugar phosphate isomerase/epimerase family protein [Haloarchaeobius sp. TZWWS8]|uniref:sugar phosphate isomerase/epimerase family protein n=1 Tax=Haloarchaeobius sp. TZWWS8 TaxID=3446121 RepID=UPI003EB87267